MDYFAVIAGGGAVGLALLARLAERGLPAVVIERNRACGMETSSRNSEVVHAGLYYPPGSLKARLCVKGNRMLSEWCVRRGVAHARIGKYVIAIDPAEEDELQRVYANAGENGVEGLSFVSAGEFAASEPLIRASSVFISPETMIIDAHGYMDSLAFAAKERGADIALCHEFLNCEPTGNGYSSNIRTPDGELCAITSNIVINSTGLDSDVTAGASGIDIMRNRYNLSWCKGHYFRLSSRIGRAINRLVYPVNGQNSPGLGIHVTKDLSGEAKLGPDTAWLDNRVRDYSVAPDLREKFYMAAGRYIRGLSPEDIYPDQSGIRPKLQAKGEGFRDFIISEESARGLPGFINLVGIESPGLTSSLAIAEYVCDYLIS